MVGRSLLLVVFCGGWSVGWFRLWWVGFGAWLVGSCCCCFFFASFLAFVSSVVVGCVPCSVWFWGCYVLGRRAIMVLLVSLGVCPCSFLLLFLLLFLFLLPSLVSWLVWLRGLVLLSFVCVLRCVRSLVGLLWCCSLLALLLVRLLLLRLLGLVFPSVLSVVVVRGLRFPFPVLCLGLLLLLVLCLVCGLLLVVAVVVLLSPLLSLLFLLVVLPCLLVLLSLLVFLLSVFRVLVPRLLWLRLLCLRCCLLFLLAWLFPLVVRVALTLPFVVSLVVLLPWRCSLLLLVGLVWGVLLLPVVLLLVFCLWLLVLVVCWLSFPSVLVLLVFVLPVPLLVVALALSALLRLPLVVVVGCCCGCPLVLVLLLGLVSPGLLLVRWVLLVAGGSAFLPLRFLSCPFFSCFAGVCPPLVQIRIASIRTLILILFFISLSLVLPSPRSLF